MEHGSRSSREIAAVPCRAYCGPIDRPARVSVLRACRTASSILPQHMRAYVADLPANASSSAQPFWCGATHRSAEKTGVPLSPSARTYE